MREELRRLTQQQRERTGIVDDKLDSWLANQEAIATTKRDQIASVERAAAHSVLGVISVWAFKNLTGNAVWDSIKVVLDLAWKKLHSRSRR